MADHEKVYSVRFDVAKAQAALGKFNKRLERSIKLVSKLEHTGKRTFRAFAQGYKKMERGAERVNRSTRKIGKTALNASKQIEKAARRSSKSFDKLGRKVSRVGSTLTRRLTLPIAIAGIASMKFAMDFNKGMANVATLTDGSLEKVTALKQGVQALAVDSGKATGDLADGLYQVISALGDTDRSMGQLDVASRGAVAGVATTEESVSLLTGVMNAYNETTVDQMKATSDLAFTAVKLGVTTYPKLAASMGRVTPLAAAMGTSQAELFATMATGTKVGAETSEVATQIASVYSAMLKPTEALTKVTKKLGYESGVAMMKDLGFRGTLIALDKAVGGNTVKMAAMLKRKEANLIATVLLGGQAENYTKILDGMEESLGATDEAYRIQTEGIDAQGHKWRQTKQKMMNFAQRLGDKLMPVLGRLLDSLEPIFKAIEKMDEGTLEWGIKLAGFLAILGPGLRIFGGLGTVVGGLVKMSGPLNSFFETQGSAAQTASRKVGGLTTKLGNLAAAVGAIAAAAAIGVAIGTVISKTVVDPHQRKKYDESWSADEKIKYAQETLKRGTYEQKQEAIKSLEGLKPEADVLQSILDFATVPFADPDYETDPKRVIRQKAAKNKALMRLKEEMPDLGAGFATESIMKDDSESGKYRAGATTVTNDIKIDARGAEPKATKRAVKEAMNEAAKAISNAASGMGATDQ